MRSFMKAVLFSGIFFCGCKAVVFEKIGVVYENDCRGNGRRFCVDQIVCDFDKTGRIVKSIRENLIQSGRCFVEGPSGCASIPVVIKVSREFSKFNEERWYSGFRTMGTALWWHGSLYHLPLIMDGHYVVGVRILCKEQQSESNAQIGYRTKEYVCWHPKWYIDDSETFVGPMCKDLSPIEEWVCTERFAREIEEIAMRLPLKNGKKGVDK